MSHNESSDDISLFHRAQAFAARTATIAPEGIFTYDELLQESCEVASTLLDSSDDLQEARVAFLVPPSFTYAAIQWGIWRAGGIAVPLSTLHPRSELEYVIEDSAADTVIVHPDFEDVLRPIAESHHLRYLTTDTLLTLKGKALDNVPSCPGEQRGGAYSSLWRGRKSISPDHRAMILYTSGTTSKPKGVVLTHRNIEAQVTSLVTAWEWTPADHILLVLPLHHVHGIINVLTCALWSGAICEMMPRFDARQVWGRFVRGGITVFMAVPTIYVKLIAAWKDASPRQKEAMSWACAAMRLMVSGSAALPVSTLETWREISGHTLLERYGMTEIGMALSNPLHGERRPGHVGVPLPGVEVRLVDEHGHEVAQSSPGEIQVKGPGVFQEYWRRPEATSGAFQDGWFRTGDIAVFENGMYRILGRNSVDIIKTGGYKVSALEIEETLRTHPAIAECAVVGAPDLEWGERVSAALVLRPGYDLTLDELRGWCKQNLAPYKVPSQIVIIDELPRNAMGKVTKPEVKQLFDNAGGSSFHSK